MGRYRRKSDKQRIAETFKLRVASPKAPLRGSISNVDSAVSKDKQVLEWDQLWLILLEFGIRGVGCEPTPARLGSQADIPWLLVVLLPIC